MDEAKREEAKKGLAEINTIVGSLDPLLKERAIGLLWSLYFPEAPAAAAAPEPKSKASGNSNTHTVSADLSSAGAFFDSFKHDKASDNVLMIAAWLYSQYGVYPITPKEVQAFADKAGLTVARRTDMTIKTAKDSGKTLFSQSGSGFEPTLAGEGYLQKTFGVKKGNQPRPQTEDGV